jgi:hypothetical protein
VEGRCEEMSERLVLVTAGRTCMKLH